MEQYVAIVKGVYFRTLNVTGLERVYIISARDSGFHGNHVMRSKSVNTLFSLLRGEGVQVNVIVTL